MLLGERIRNIRKLKGMSILQVREITGLSKSTISEIENDKSSPTAETLQKIASALNVSVDEFFKDSNTNIKTNIDKVLPVIPKEFTNPGDARVYLSKHQIFGSNGINVSKMSDEKVLEFANELLRQMELISYKYRD